MPVELRSASSARIFINGRFLGRPVTGVERFAGSILGEIDAALASTHISRFTVLAPQGVARPAWLKNLGFENTGSRTGHAWEQTDLWRASRDGVLVNLCNSGPVLHGRQLTVLHDALVYRHPENFSRSYGTFHRLLGRLLAKRANLATVSDFSRQELSKLLGVAADGIGLVPNAIDHVFSVEPDVSVLQKFDLETRPFFLFVGSPANNKNLAGAIRAFIALDKPDVAFVMVGGAANTFAKSLLGELPENVVSTGRLTDEEIQALYRKAAALVFPSIYEGFGIPPLEAMAVGCPVIASDIPPVREVCRDAVIYFDPHHVASITSAMRDVVDGVVDIAAVRERGLARTADFSWKKSAERLLAMIGDVEHDNRISDPTSVGIR
ncbi:glycosyltransferase involved in cell wall biosynthesis [Neorhizobium huautlense]|uniref:Glycosyltransferase involved in cell wall biosynthesis n=1 Tax=Neorhizobium huautlense TaxID=67774 RepID=A0ABT9PNV2_9HYPH|nr:glycosyltransferase family 1 protein [Neorhizobium huautlense]MDP9835866.1 glycosyltransferase involved in cell wall biosynthesis [Neorhizobium huautlense]